MGRWNPSCTDIVTVTQDRVVRVEQLLGDRHDGQRAPRWTTGPGENIHDLCWLPGGLGLVVARAFLPLQVLDGEGGAVRGTFNAVDHGGEFAPVGSVAASPVLGGPLAGGSPRGGAVFLFDTVTGVAGSTLYACAGSDGRRCKSRIVSSLAFAPGSPSLLACGSFDGSVTLMDVRNPRPEAAVYMVTAPSHGHGRGVTQVSFASGGALLVAGCRRGPRSLMVWDVRRSEAGEAAPHWDMPRACPSSQRLYFSVKDDWVATGTGEGQVAIFSASTGTTLAMWSHAQDRKDPVPVCDWHPDSPYLATASGGRDPRGQESSLSSEEEEEEVKKEGGDFEGGGEDPPRHKSSLKVFRVFDVG
jgi:WD40 repeat protein